MRLELERIAYLPDVTLGLLRVGAQEWKTLEEPWRPNPDGPGGMRGESCVPDGTYRLVPHNGQTKRNVLALVNPLLGVYHQPGDMPHAARWGRAAVLIHSGNTTDDIQGCILVGKTFGRLAAKPAVLSSVLALEEMRQVVAPTLEHQLIIRPTSGTTQQGAPP